MTTLCDLREMLASGAPPWVRTAGDVWWRIFESSWTPPSHGQPREPAGLSTCNRWCQCINPSCVLQATPVDIIEGSLDSKDFYAK